MSRHFEEAQQRRMDEYVAGELGISTKVLDDHPFELDDDSSEGGIALNWRVMWQENVPPGVDAQGPEGYRWSVIDIRHVDDSEPDD